MDWNRAARFLWWAYAWHAGLSLVLTVAGPASAARHHIIAAMIDLTLMSLLHRQAWSR